MSLVGWQLHVAEFDGVKHVYLLSKGWVCSVVWSSCSELQSCKIWIQWVGSYMWQSSMELNMCTYYPKDGSPVLVLDKIFRVTKLTCFCVDRLCVYRPTRVIICAACAPCRATINIQFSSVQFSSIAWCSAQTKRYWRSTCAPTRQNWKNIWGSLTELDKFTFSQLVRNILKEHQNRAWSMHHDFSALYWMPHHLYDRINLMYLYML